MEAARIGNRRWCRLRIASASSAADGAIGILPAERHCSSGIRAYISHGGTAPAHGRPGSAWPSPSQTFLTPAQILLAQGTLTNVERPNLTTAKTLDRARENYNLSEIPEAAVDEIGGFRPNPLLNSVVATGVPGFIAKGG